MRFIRYTVRVCASCNIRSPTMIITVTTRDELTSWHAVLEKNTAASVEALRALSGAPLEALRKIKFDRIGRHPLENRPLNLIEQVNQTFTYLVALKATELLLDWHPEAGGFRLAPGAHAPRGTLDIESLRPGVVGAETFAAPPTNNRKLAGDLQKLSSRAEHHRYVFFAAPGFDTTKRQVDLEREGIQVWSVDTESA